MSAIKWFLKTHTLYRCDRHGQVAGSIFTPSPDSKFSMGKYGISYCCGTTYGGSRNIRPVTMWEQLLEELDIEALVDQE